jgi:hypothetical protein
MNEDMEIKEIAKILFNMRPYMRKWKIETVI